MYKTTGNHLAFTSITYRYRETYRYFNDYKKKRMLHITKHIAPTGYEGESKGKGK